MTLGVTTKNESRANRLIVIPAQAGIQRSALNAGFHRYDGWVFGQKPEPSFFEACRTPDGVYPVLRYGAGVTGLGGFLDTL